MKKKLIAWLCATSLLVCGTASPICRSASKKAGLSSIEQSTYSYCSDLTSINIPDNVTSIGLWQHSRIVPT